MIHVGDAVEVMAAMEPDSIDAIVTDPPYGLEFMGKEWDRLDGRFSKPGIGERPTAWPNHGDEFAGYNPTCATCGGRLRGARKCECAEPDWKVKGIRLDGVGKVKTWGEWPGGWGRPTTMPTAQANVRCRNCKGWKVGRKTNASKCNCDRPEFPDVQREGRHAMQAWHQAWATEALRVAKPGAYLLAFGGTRTVHRLTVALEDAGWIIRDVLCWVYACLSDDTEVLTSEGWVRYNRASEGQHAAAFDQTTGALRWEPIEAVHRYHHEGDMAEVGPSLVTLNHRVVLDATEGLEQVPLPGDADLRRLWRDVPNVDEGAGDPEQDVLPRVLVGAAAGTTGQDAAGRTQGPDGGVRGLSSAGLATRGLDQQDDRGHVLVSVQRHPEAAGPTLPYRDPSGLDRGVVAVLPRVDDRPEEPRLEGRRYRVQEAWQLLGSPLRASAGMGEADGPQGRLRHGASADDGWALRLPDDTDGMREPREPRPDRQPPREPDALAEQSDAQALRARQMAAGDGEPDTVRLVPYVGTVWCITVPSGAFVARRNGVVFVTGNSGFPKSKSSLKPAWEPIVLARKPGPLRELAIDECRIGTEQTATLRSDGVDGTSFPRYGKPPGIYPNEVPGRWPANVVLTANPEGGPEAFDGGWEGVVGGGTSPDTWGQATQRTTSRGWYGTRVKGEDKPIGYGDTGTYSRFFALPDDGRSGMLSACHICGATTADETSTARTPIGATAPPNADMPPSERSAQPASGVASPSDSCETATAPCPAPTPLDGTPDRSTASEGRSHIGNGTSATETSIWPEERHAIASHSPQPARTAARPKTSTVTTTTTPSLSLCERCADAATSEHIQPPPRPTDDELLGDGLPPDAPRFYLVAKASRADREPDVPGGIATLDGGVWGGDEDDLTPGKKRTIPRVNGHPTVKPTALMRHLIRLVTPRGGVVLDPFLGSGSTAKAAVLEGFDWVGIEREAEYTRILEQRLVDLQQGMGLDVLAPIEPWKDYPTAVRYPVKGPSRSSWFTPSTRQASGEESASVESVELQQGLGL